MKFNVLVTTYEFIMYDRSKLSKVDWKYIIIDEAQRMKDRESVLARDLDRYRCQRRLLLTGTPLQVCYYALNSCSMSKLGFSALTYFYKFEKYFSLRCHLIWKFESHYCDWAKHLEYSFVLGL